MITTINYHKYLLRLQQKTILAVIIKTAGCPQLNLCTRLLVYIGDSGIYAILL